MESLTIVEVARRFRSGELTSAEVTRRCLARADRLDGELSVFARRWDETAMTTAAQADRELSSGHDRGPLHGIPIGIKDVIFTREAPTRAGSDVRSAAWSSTSDAPVVERLRAAGAIIVGKTTTMEFALGAPDVTKPATLPRNPCNPECWAGGSSSGSAAGIGAGMFLGALGTDTGGSIRLPACYTGICGLKPTFGLIPTEGSIRLAPTLDVIGPMARTVLDCALLLGAIAGRDVPRQLERPVDGLRIGVWRPHARDDRNASADLCRAFETGLSVLRTAGAMTVDVELPYYEQLSAAMRVTVASEALAYHRAELRRSWSEYGRAMRLALASGAMFSGADYVCAQNDRDIGRQCLAAILDDVDVIVSPTASTVAPQVNALDYDAIEASAFTPIWNATGHPALSMPMGLDADGLPFGLQFVGRCFDEETILSAAQAYERRTQWYRQLPDPAGATPA